MTDLLLITDVPRLRKIFSRLADSSDIRLRIANSLEKGGEELAAEKPAIVFVQTHLSGLSAEIILMHLKKQLGRRRSRFVLLSAPAHAGSETVRLYHGHIDTSLADDALHISIKEMIATLLTKATKTVAVEAVASETIHTEPQLPQAETPTDNIPAIIPAEPETKASPVILQDEPSLADQGLTYAPRSRMSVYSEFNSSFDSAVSDIKPATTLDKAEPELSHTWDHDTIETIESSSVRSKRTSFLLWAAPVVIAVIVITILQHNRSKPASTEVTQQSQTSSATTAASSDQKLTADTSVAPLQTQKPPTLPSSTEMNSPLTDNAVLSAIAENRGNKKQNASPAGTRRLTTLPDFIPRSGLDKAYARTNLGWERYKGQVTEFKIFREGTSIKAIQVIDRGGNGVPESFMKTAIRQVSKNQTFVLESTEKKEGYEIQRGHVSENLKVLYYRDDQGGKLRAFVLTWQ